MFLCGLIASGGTAPVQAARSSCPGLFQPVVVTMPVTRTVLPRQFGSCRSAPAGSVTEVFAVLEPCNDSQ